MRSYNIKLPRGLEVDIFNLPEDFEEMVIKSFRDYTEETAKDYRYCDKLGFIDCFVKNLNRATDSYSAVNRLVEEVIVYEWRENGELVTEDDIYSVEFMEKCYEAGQNSMKLHSHFGSDDHHIYDQIQRVLVQVITIVMNYEE